MVVLSYHVHKLTFEGSVLFMKKQFIFTIGTDEIVIKANGMIDAISQVKKIVVERGNEKNKLKFVGVKY